jgi:hypothetical protein
LLIGRPISNHWIVLAVLAVAIALWLLPGRPSIAPRVESDYCYQLIAADRLHAGRGLTSLQPSAPRQPWKWSYDFGFLTQWPPGYALLVAGLRAATGASTIQACQWIGILACSAACVGWFVFLRRALCIPSRDAGLPGTLLAAAAAGCAVPFSFLVDPFTDACVVAILPFLLISVLGAVESPSSTEGTGCRPSSIAGFAGIGLAAGSLFWIRYAACFVPAAIALYFLLERIRRGFPCLRRVAAFLGGAMAPVGALLATNRWLAPPTSSGRSNALYTQLNLGERVEISASLQPLWTAWRQFTDLKFYDHRPEAAWVLAFWPILLALIVGFVPAVRRRLRPIITSPGFLLGGVVTASLLLVLVVATVVFGDKFQYVELDRYYLPIRPMYFLLFVAPVLWFRSWVVRAVGGLALVLAVHWMALHEWAPAYGRRLAAPGELTPQGRQAVCFTPGASALYGWLSSLDASRDVVFSNFHDYITLETGAILPAYPIPAGVESLEESLDGIRQARGIQEPRVLFVLDPDHRWRSRFLPPYSELLDRFALHRRVSLPPGTSAVVFEYASTPPTSSSVEDGAHSARFSRP